MVVCGRYDFKTTFHKNPQLTTTYRQKAPIAQYVRRIDGQIAVRFCAICSIYIMPKALCDILTVSILIGGCVFLFAKLVCAAILPRVYIPTLHCSKMAAHTSLANKKRILRLKYSSKYRNRCLLAVSCGKLWIFVESLEVKPVCGQHTSMPLGTGHARIE